MKNPILKSTLAATLLAAPLQAQGIPNVMAPDAKVERIATGFLFTEGPVWDQSGFLLFTDIPANSIYKWTPPIEGEAESKAEVFRKPSGNANGLAFTVGGNLLACEHSTRRVSFSAFGGVFTIADKYEGKRFNSPNDLTIAPDGAIYFTDPAYGLPKMTEGKELDFEGVFRLAPDGTLTLLARDFVHPNGIALSPDGKRLYVNDSDTQLSHMRVFDVQADGTLANGRIFAELKEAGKRGVPDGMKVDALGNIYSTGPGGVWIFAPDGKLLGKIEVPEVTTNLGWGDDDFQTLYITAGKSVYRVRMLVEGHR